MAEPDYNQTFLTELHQKLDRHFDEEELRTLCFNLQVEYDTLPAQGKGNKAREIVNYLSRRGRIPDLIGQLRVERPLVPWQGPNVDDNDSDETIEFETVKFSAPPIAALVIKSASNTEEWVFITEATRRFIVGRGKFSDVNVPEMGMSKRHFTIIVSKEKGSDNENQSYQVGVMDLHSSNSTYVNGQRIQEHLLKDGDIITVGNTSFRFIWLHDSHRTMNIP